MTCSTCQCVILELKAVSGVQPMLVCDIRSNSGQWRAACQCMILEE